VRGDLIMAAGGTGCGIAPTRLTCGGLRKALIPKKNCAAIFGRFWTRIRTEADVGDYDQTF